MNMLFFRRRRTPIGILVRIGVAIALLFPLAWFTAGYLWAHHSMAGFPVALATALFDTAISWIYIAIAHPLRTILFLVVTSLLWRWAFGHRRGLRRR